MLASLESRVYLSIIIQTDMETEPKNWYKNEQLMLEAKKALTPKENKVFTINCKELIEHTRVYGIPQITSHFVIDRMMYYRLQGIKARPDLLEIARRLDTKGVLF